jgi:acetate kinase
MGFTPLEGLVMATRSGNIDPGLVLWLQRRAKLSRSRLTEILDRSSGLIGLAGTGDMRELLKRVRARDARAKLAFEIYIHRLQSLIASMAAAMNGADAMVFTGGVGENSREVRAAAVKGLSFLGLELDIAKNSRAGKADADVSAEGAPARTLVVHAREDIEVAREVRRLPSRARPRPV